ncbi:MAG: hypothetical protein WBD17_08265, partial [Candidatus Omnitrophota bacterium]
TYFTDLGIEELVDLSRSYYKVERSGLQYILTDAATGDVYTSNAEGTEIEVAGTRYAVEEIGEKVTFTEIQTDASAVEAHWMELAGTYYKVINIAPLEFNLSNELGDSIDVTVGSQVDIAGVIYNVTGSPGTEEDLVLTEDGGTATSTHVAQWGITVKGREYAVIDTAGMTEIFNNTERYAESADSTISIPDAEALLVVSGSLGTLNLLQVMRADLDNNGIINDVDESFIAGALLSGTYDPSADINGDGIVDDIDLAIFLSQRFSTSQVGRYTITGPAGMEKDYFVSRTGEGRHAFDEAGASENAVLTEESGSFVRDLLYANYTMANDLISDAADMTMFSMEEDTRVYHFSDGFQEVGSAAITDTFVHDGTTYKVGGTGMNDLVLISYGNWEKSLEVTAPTVLYDGDIYSQSQMKMITDDFEEGLDGWIPSDTTNTRTQQIGDTMILGGYKGLGASDSVSKTFTVPKEVFTIEFDAYFIDYWVAGHGDRLWLQVNGDQIWQLYHETGWDEHDGLELIEQVGRDYDSDFMGHFEAVVDNTQGSDTITLTFGVPALYSSGFWGIDNVEFVKDTGTAALYSGYDKDEVIECDYSDNALINGFAYHFDTSDPDNIFLEGPVSRSAHVKEKEKTYMVTGDDIETVSVSEFILNSEPTGEDVVALDIDGDIVFLNVYTTGDAGVLAFDDSLYPSMTTEFDGEYMTLNTHRVIELEGAEYKVVLEATTGTYELYDSAGSLAKGGLQITADGQYTTEMNGVVYKIFGTSADDFKLESIIEPAYYDVDEPVVTIGSEHLKITESVAGRTPQESTKSASRAVALYEEEPVLITLDDFDDDNTGGWEFYGNNYANWIVENNSLYQAFSHNWNYQTGDMWAIYRYSDSAEAPELLTGDDCMISASIRPDAYSQWGYYAGPVGGYLYLRYVDEENFYRMRFDDDSDTVKLQRMKDGDLVTLAATNVKTEYGIDIVEDQWYQCAFSIRDNRLIGYFEGLEVVSAVDDPESTIEAGFSGVGCLNNSKSYFDDIEIHKLDSWENTYYDVDEAWAGSYTSYVFTDTALAAVYTSDSAGEVIIKGTTYIVTVDG